MYIIVVKCRVRCTKCCCDVDISSTPEEEAMCCSRIIETMGMDATVPVLYMK